MSQFTTFGTTQRVEMLPGVSRQMLSCGERAMVVRIELKQGSEVPLHSHPHEQMGLVVSGQITMTIDGVSYPLEPDECYQIPGGVEHGAAAGPNGCRVLDLFHPVREDYVARAGG